MSICQGFNKLVHCIVLGNTNVGKTTFCHKLVYNELPSEYISTIGVDFFIKKTKINNNNIIKLCIWDTAGQEKYNCIVNTFYRNKDLAIYIFSYNDINSFYDMNNWRDKMNRSCGKQFKEIIIGTNIDKIKFNKKIAENYCSNNNINLININLLRENVIDKLNLVLKDLFIDDISTKKKYKLNKKSFSNEINKLSNIIVENDNKKEKCCTIL
jgi:Ras-related protein Rab-7A